MVLKSFVEVNLESHFPLENLPYGIFKSGNEADPPRPCIAIGDFVFNLSAVSSAGLFNGPLLKNSDCFHQTSLSKFVGMGRPTWKEAHSTIQKMLSFKTGSKMGERDDENGLYGSVSAEVVEMLRWYAEWKIQIKQN